MRAHQHILAVAMLFGCGFNTSPVAGGNVAGGTAGSGSGQQRFDSSDLYQVETADAGVESDGIAPEPVDSALPVEEPDTGGAVPDVPEPAPEPPVVPPEPLPEPEPPRGAVIGECPGTTVCTEAGGGSDFCVPADAVGFDPLTTGECSGRCDPLVRDGVRWDQLCARPSVDYPLDAKHCIVVCYQ